MKTPTIFGIELKEIDSSSQHASYKGSFGVPALEFFVGGNFRTHAWVAEAKFDTPFSENHGLKQEVMVVYGSSMEDVCIQLETELAKLTGVLMALAWKSVQPTFTFTARLHP